MIGLRPEREVPETVEVRVGVRSGTARFGVAVQADSTDRMLSLVAGRYPTGSCRLEPPIEAEGFFVEGPANRARMVQQPKELAA
jgi:hypothetical protein